MRIGIVGSGITGLSAAYYLSKKENPVTIFESSDTIGGLAGSIKIGETYIEKYYHHIFKNDLYIIKLIKKLGLSNKLIWEKSNVGFLFERDIIPFSTVFDLLKFNPLPFIDRIKFGLTIYYFKSISNWRNLDSISIYNWHQKNKLKRIFNTVWAPLLRSKFGDSYKDISCAWLWGRIHPRAKSRSKGYEKLGYIKGGFQVLFDELKNKIENHGGKFKLSEKVDRVISECNKIKIITNKKETFYFDKVILTVSLPEFNRIVANLPKEFEQRNKKVEYRSVECVMLLLNRPLSGIYWMNICDDSMAFNGIIEHTNFIPSKCYNGIHVIYIFRYKPICENQNENTDTTVLYCLDFLKELFPKFHESWIIRTHLIRDIYATPIYSVEYISKKPDIKTPLNNIFIANMAQIYPEDRTMNNCVKIGLDAADIIINKGQSIS